MLEMGTRFRFESPHGASLMFRALVLLWSLQEEGEVSASRSEHCQAGSVGFRACPACQIIRRFGLGVEQLLKTAFGKNAAGKFEAVCALVQDRKLESFDG